MAGISGVNYTEPEIKVVDPDKIGFAGMSSEDFMGILIEQLKNQDPSDPMDSDQMLSQISNMRNLQASIELQSSLESLTLSQQLNSSTNFIGKTVTGTVGEEETQVSGVVTSVLIREGAAILKMGSQELELKNVTGIQE